MAIDPSPELERISRNLAVEKGLDEKARLELLDSYLDFLCRAAGTREVSYPSISVDEIWHRHILDTQSYARDCSLWFGSFIHHQPDSIPDEASQGIHALATCGAQDPPPCSGRIGKTLADCGAPAPCNGRIGPTPADGSGPNPSPCKTLAATAR